VAAGFGIFFLLRIPVAGLPFIGEPFFPAELSLGLRTSSRSPIDRVPVFAAVAAGWRCAGEHLPARRCPPGRHPRRRASGGWCRCWPAWPSSPSGPSRPPSLHPRADPGVRIKLRAHIVGLFIAGPWLTMAAARVMAWRTSRPATLIVRLPPRRRPQGRLPRRQRLVLALSSPRGRGGDHHAERQDLTRWGSGRRSERADDQVSGSNSAAGSGPERVRARCGRGLRARRAADGKAARIPGVQGGTRVRAVPGLTIPRHCSPANSSPPAPVRPAWSRARSSRPSPPLAAAGRGGGGAFPSDGFNGSLFGTDATTITWRPRTSRPRGWTPSAWTHQRGDERRHAGVEQGKDGA